jgi:RNA polymerase sigma-70 factor (ECF subfamily)
MLSEKDLIKGCKEYNSKAQQELYERYSRKMNAVCYYYTGSVEDAKDLLHEGFIKVFSNIRQYKEEGSFEGWIRKIMVNTAIDFLNKKKTRPDSFFYKEEEEEKLAATEEEEENENSFTQEEILKALSHLSDEHRLIFNMSCLEGYSHKEIGEKLSIPENTCRSKLRRARNILREYLEILKSRKSD